MANYVSNVTIPTNDGSATYNIRELFPHVGNCTVAASAAAKTVTIGNFKLYTGAWVVVKFSNTNSAAVASLTLNVDGTGAKPIKYRNANLSSAGLLIANRYTYFVYDGTNYQIVGDFDTNSDTYDRNRYKANIKAGTSALVAANIIVGKDGVFNHLKSGGSFDISYPILYLNEAVAASATTTNTYDILHITITTTQSITLTAYKPVFIKGTLSGTIFTPVSATPLTQTVPTTDDGYVYIYLGNATSTTTMYLQERHPIYAYKNNAFGEIVHTASNVNGYTVGKSVPANALFTDELMAQTNTTGSADYRVLLSGNANDTTETTTGRKSTNLKFNPSTGILSASSGVTTKTITRSALKGMLTGSGTAAQDKGSGVSPRYFPAKWTFNTGLTAANGDIFIIKLPTAGHSYGVFLSIDNGANYYPISVNGTSRLTTHYGNGYSIAVMFKSDGSTDDVFPLAGGDSRSTITGGCWQVLNYYDSGNTNTKVTQTADNSSNSDNYELLISNSANNTTETAGARKSTRFRFNPSTGRVIMQGPLIVRATDGVGSYDEGIRINAGKNGYSTLSFGGGQDTLSGTADGQFWMGTNSTNDSYKRKLYIAHAGSTGSGTYFYVSSASQVSPALKLGTSGAIASGNGDAVSGGVVYTALGNYLPLSGGTMTGDITFTGISPSSYPAASKGIKWSGGTDAIDMYYNLRASDAGELIINMRDDTNVRTSFAYNGTIVSYIDTSGVYNGKATSATYANHLRYGLLVDNSENWSSYPWHKFAQATFTGINTDSTITFLVSKTWGGTPSGILTAHVRTSETKIYGGGNLTWHLKGADIKLENFVMVYTNTADTSTKIELWYKQEGRWDGWVFVVLKENYRESVNPATWTLYSGTDGNSQRAASYTSGTGTVVSALENISNNASTSTKATQDGDGNTISSTYLKLSGGTMTGDIEYVGDGNRKIALGKNSFKYYVASNAGWAGGLSYYSNDGSTGLGYFGAYGQANTLEYHFIGGTYNAPQIKIEPTGPNLIINSEDASTPMITFFRKGSNKADWRIVNTGGNLKFQSDYTTTVGDWYDALTVEYNTGNITMKTNATFTFGKFGSASANANRHVFFKEDGANRICVNDNFKYNPSTNILTVGSITGSAATWTTGRTFTIGSTGKSVDGSGNVSWTLSEIGAAASSHAHGNITSGGALQTTDITIASGDKLVVTDSSNSNKVARASISFDGSTTSKCLTQKGTWETPPDTKNTAGSTDTSSKIFLIGATSQAANQQTYSDDQCYVTSGTLQANKVQASVTLCANTANSNSAGGIALYGTDPTAYGIMFRGTTNSGKHGYVQSDWATYFTMNEGGTTRGWIFRRGTTNVGSVSGAGHAVFNGSVTVGGNTTNTSGCRMEYNSSTQTLDFVFV